MHARQPQINMACPKGSSTFLNPPSLIHRQAPSPQRKANCTSQFAKRNESFPRKERNKSINQQSDQRADDERDGGLGILGNIFAHHPNLRKSTTHEQAYHAKHNPPATTEIHEVQHPTSPGQCAPLPRENECDALHGEHDDTAAQELGEQRGSESGVSAAAPFKPHDTAASSFKGTIHLPFFWAALVVLPATSFLFTSLITPTATVTRMSRTAKRPRGG